MKERQLKRSGIKLELLGTPLILANSPASATHPYLACAAYGASTVPTPPKHRRCSWGRRMWLRGLR